MIRHLIFRVPIEGTIILTTTHVLLLMGEALNDLENVLHKQDFQGVGT